MSNFALCTSAAIVAKAGVGANSDAVASGALLNQFYLEGEGQFCGATHRDWAKDANNLNAQVSGAVAAAISSLAAIQLINYDQSLYFSREIVQTQLDVLRDQAGIIIRDLKDFDSSKLKGVA